MSKLIGLIVVIVITLTHQATIYQFIRDHLPYERISCSNGKVLMYTENTQNVVNSYMNPDYLAQKIQEDINAVNAEVEQKTAEYDTNVASLVEHMNTLQLQLDSFKAAFDEQVGPLVSRLAGLEDAKAEICGNTGEEQG